jgi:hypothetical protein
VLFFDPRACRASSRGAAARASQTTARVRIPIPLLRFRLNFVALPGPLNKSRLGMTLHATMLNCVLQ